LVKKENLEFSSEGNPISPALTDHSHRCLTFSYKSHLLSSLPLVLNLKPASLLRSWNKLVLNPAT